MNRPLSARDPVAGWFTAVLFVLGLTACPPPATPDPAPAPPAGVITRFAASSTQVTNPGDKVTLSWETTGAEVVALEQLEEGPLAIDSAAATGSLEVTIARDTLFALTARGPGGTDTKVVSVVLERGGNVMLFTALPAVVVAGEPVSLVWNAPGAQSVALQQVGGQPIDVGAQRASGSVRVTPGRSTSYRLTVDGRTADVSVVVQPAIFTFALEGRSPLPGQPLTVTWRTGGATRATLTRAGLATPLTSVTGGLVANGTFTDTAPANLPVDGLVEYTLEIESGPMKVKKTLVVTLGGAVRIDAFEVPRFAKPGAVYVVSWRTTGVTRLELRLDGQLYFTGSSASQLAADSLVLPAPASTAVVELTVRNALGSVARQTRQVSLVGLPVFNSFTADTTTLAQGGTPLVLRWNVTNARSVRIVEQPGAREVFATQGMVDTGVATVYPNQPSITYELRADNTVGDAIAPQTVAITVASLATLTFSRKLPVGLSTEVTGSTVPGNGAILGLPTVAQDVPGDGFIDISQTGTSIAYSGPDTTSKLVTLPERFTMMLFGRPLSGDKLSININGWFVFSATAVGSSTTTDDNDDPLPSQVLEPLAFAPYWDDLYHIAADPLSAIFYQLDGSGENRRLIIQYNEIEHDDFTGSRLTFQAQLYASGKVVYAYDKLDVPDISPSVGIVSANEQGALLAPALPAEGRSFTFFGPATLPVEVPIDGEPITARVVVNDTTIEVTGNPAIVPGQFAITEVNPWPAAGIVRGEWLEITNFGADPVDLDGWVLDFGNGLAHTLVTPPVLPPNGRLLLSQVPGAGDGLPVDYVYGAGYQMNDTFGDVRLTLLGADYSRATWSAAQVTGPGLSVQSDPTARNLRYASTLAQVPCASSAASTYGTHGQRGTPRAAHPR
ncbi:MAG: lamin tail domain-containing protein, partial [Myxococcaceae bacterium]|nr:lamin tail domain-containing protein [Myxococcaceae bacterium]